MILQEVALAIVVALTGWWFSTGLILLLVHSKTPSPRSTFMAATAVMLMTLMAVPVVAAESSSAMTVLGFCLGLLLWGWLEMGYLMGFVTGPNCQACPPRTPLISRLRLGLGTTLWHELWLLLLVLSLFVLSHQQPNQITLWTFSALWLMRWSAKLNLVLGVRNYNRNWLPSHLGYLDTYIPRKPFNALFPLSLFAGSAATVALFSAATGAESVALVIAYTLVAALVALGTLEHIFLMFPMGDARLWQWAAPKATNLPPLASEQSSP